ncbi:P-loop containing nucleoside triphosphate hydrolase protein [Clavulina sp. PMI_390]|nr:P-loop containing nucleoside triphosphate hydrolase protein [Clavulina sp. PMI_390]
MVILCGVVGSGKSTFALAFQQYYPSFVRLSQDDLGSRQAVEHAARSNLRAGRSVIIDRTNIDVSQRRVWITLARQEVVDEIWGVFLDAPYETCVQRLRSRADHPTLRPEDAIRVLNRFWNDFQEPLYREGFDRLITLAPHHALSYSFDDIAGIVDFILQQRQ